MKLSILMPTYNDAESIIETLDSLLAQTHHNWELIIIDDGSKDNTKKVIEQYIQKHKETRIQYHYQKNQDQLNALKNGMQYITGDYVYILHSDDLLATSNVLEQAINYLQNHPNLDGIIADLLVIDKDSKIVGKQKVKNYKNQEYVMPLQLLFLGRNLFVDFAFHKVETFKKNVYHNYLTWNGPFWLDVDTPSMLKIKKVDFPFIKYRVFEGNYIHNEIGLLNVVSGELRVVTSLMKHYHLPNYGFQYKLYRLFTKCHLEKLYRSIYQNKETKNKGKVIEFVFNKRFPNQEYQKYPHLKAILSFYKNPNHRTITVSSIGNVYLGSDMRLFNTKIVNQDISEFYRHLFEEMEKGFDKVVVKKKHKEDMKNILRFLGIHQDVEIICEEDIK